MFLPYKTEGDPHCMVCAFLNKAQQVTFVTTTALEIQRASVHFSTFIFSPSVCPPAVTPGFSLPGNGRCLPSGRRLHHSPSQQPASSQSCSQQATFVQAASHFGQVHQAASLQFTSGDFLQLLCWYFPAHVVLLQRYSSRKVCCDPK